MDSQKRHYVPLEYLPLDLQVRGKRVEAPLHPNLFEKLYKEFQTTQDPYILKLLLYSQAFGLGATDQLEAIKTEPAEHIQPYPPEQAFTQNDTHLFRLSLLFQERCANFQSALFQNNIENICYKFLALINSPAVSVGEVPFLFEKVVDSLIDRRSKSENKLSAVFSKLFSELSKLDDSLQVVLLSIAYEKAKFLNDKNLNLVLLRLSHQVFLRVDVQKSREIRAELFAILEDQWSQDFDEAHKSLCMFVIDLTKNPDGLMALEESLIVIFELLYKTPVDQFNKISDIHVKIIDVTKKLKVSPELRSFIENKLESLSSESEKSQLLVFYTRFATRQGISFERVTTTLNNNLEENPGLLSPDIVKAVLFNNHNKNHQELLPLFKNIFDGAMAGKPEVLHLFTVITASGLSSTSLKALVDSLTEERWLFLLSLDRRKTFRSEDPQFHYFLSRVIIEANVPIDDSKLGVQPQLLAKIFCALLVSDDHESIKKYAPYFESDFGALIFSALSQYSSEAVRSLISSLDESKVDYAKSFTPENISLAIRNAHSSSKPADISVLLETAKKLGHYLGSDTQLKEIIEAWFHKHYKDKYLSFIENPDRPSLINGMFSNLTNLRKQNLIPSDVFFDIVNTILDRSLASRIGRLSKISRTIKTVIYEEFEDDTISGDFFRELWKMLVAVKEEEPLLFKKLTTLTLQLLEQKKSPLSANSVVGGIGNIANVDPKLLTHLFQNASLHMLRSFSKQLPKLENAEEYSRIVIERLNNSDKSLASIYTENSQFTDYDQKVIETLIYVGATHQAEYLIKVAKSKIVQLVNTFGSLREGIFDAISKVYDLALKISPEFKDEMESSFAHEIIKLIQVLQVRGHESILQTAINKDELEIILKVLGEEWFCEAFKGIAQTDKLKTAAQLLHLKSNFSNQELLQQIIDNLVSQAVTLKYDPKLLKELLISYGEEIFQLFETQEKIQRFFLEDQDAFLKKLDLVNSNFSSPSTMNILRMLLKMGFDKTCIQPYIEQLLDPEAGYYDDFPFEYQSEIYLFAQNDLGIDFSNFSILQKSIKDTTKDTDAFFIAQKLLPNRIKDRNLVDAATHWQNLSSLKKKISTINKEIRTDLQTNVESFWHTHFESISYMARENSSLVQEVINSSRQLGLEKTGEVLNSFKELPVEITKPLLKISNVSAAQFQSLVELAHAYLQIKDSNSPDFLVTLQGYLQTESDISEIIRKMGKKLFTTFGDKIGVDKSKIVSGLEERWDLYLLPKMFAGLFSYENNYREYLRLIIKMDLLGEIDQMMQTEPVAPDVNNYTEEERELIWNMYQHIGHVKSEFKEAGIDFSTWDRYSPENSFSVGENSSADKMNVLTKNVEGILWEIITVLKKSAPSDKPFFVGRLPQFANFQDLFKLGKNGLEIAPLGETNPQKWDSFCLGLAELFGQFISTSADTQTITELQTAQSHVLDIINFVKEAKEETSKKAISFTIRESQRQPGKFLFHGNYTHCCIAIGHANRGAVVDYIWNRSIKILEIVDQSTDRVMGQIFTMLVIDGQDQVSLMIDNIEIAQKYSPYKKNLREESFKYVWQFVEELNSKSKHKIEKVLMGTSYQDVDVKDLARVSEYVTKIGGSVFRYEYLDWQGGWDDSGSRQRFSGVEVPRPFDAEALRSMIGNMDIAVVTGSEKNRHQQWQKVSSDIIAVENAAFPTGAESEIGIQAKFINPNGVFITAQADGRTIAYSASNLTDGPNGEKCLYVYSTAVHPSFQGQGIVWKMLDQLEAECQKRGIRYLSRDARTANNYAQKLLKRYGDAVIKQNQHDSSYGPQVYMLIDLNRYQTL